MQLFAKFKKILRRGYRATLNFREGGRFTRGSKYSDLTWKLLVFWKTGRRGEVVTTEGSTVDKMNYGFLAGSDK